MLGPTDFGSLSRHFSPLFLGHGLEPTLAADLTTLAVYGLAMYADRSTGGAGFGGTIISSTGSAVEQSTIHLAAGSDHAGVFLCRQSFISALAHRPHIRSMTPSTNMVKNIRNRNPETRMLDLVSMVIRLSLSLARLRTFTAKLFGNWVILSRRQP
jgi:hypothetical protein